MESERERIQQRINALRKSRDTYAAYGDPVSGDRLLDAISELERQLIETHKKPTTQEEGNSD